MPDAARPADIPSPELAGAYLRLGALDTAAAPMWAAWWILDGHDGAAVVELAGLDNTYPLDVRDAMVAALEEIGVSQSDLADAARLAFNDQARKCLDGLIDEHDLVMWVERIYMTSDYDDAIRDEPLGETFGIDDEWQGRWGRTEAEMRSAVRAACAEQLRRSDDPRSPSAECEVLPLPPRWVPLRLWKVTVSEFVFDDGVDLQRVSWGVRTVTILRPEAESIRLWYVAPNEIWMRKAVLCAAELEGKLVTYRARLLPFLKPKVSVTTAEPRRA